MNFSKLELVGLRGFSEKQELNLGIPNGNSGSGLTTIIGPNNSGKSTIYEAFRAISQNNTPSFTEGRRNKIADDKIEITITNNSKEKLTLKTVQSGGSETEFVSLGLEKQNVKFYTLPSRRTFSPFFHKGEHDRSTFINSANLPAVRGSDYNHFSYRLYTIQKNQSAFNSVASRVLGHIPDWTIDQNDNGQHFLKFNYNGSYHNSDGSGEGLLSIFTIVDTLYDSIEDDLIFIDEPELSLHPSVQRKLLDLFLDYSRTRQIVISTHSPYFISWKSVENGGQIVRTVREKNGTKIYQLKKETAKKIVPLINDLHNPHILGLDAREIFFLDDNILLVEGQEDVIFLKRILDIKNKALNGTFYGWGVGGASNTPKVLEMLKDLGFTKIAVILDNNMKSMQNKLEKLFPEYFIVSIPTDDIREKKETRSKPSVEGLIDFEGKTFNAKYDRNFEKMLREINSYLT